MVQCYFLLWLMAKLTGKKPGKAYHKLINVHIYENQLPQVEEQLQRQPYASPNLLCTREFTLEDVFDDTRETALHPDDFTVVNYQHHPAIKYPFTV